MAEKFNFKPLNGKYKKINIFSFNNVYIKVTFLNFICKISANS